MILKRDSTEHYSKFEDLWKDIVPNVEGIAGAILKDSCDHKEDCQQNIYIYIFEAFKDIDRILTFQHLINKIWWKTIDFTRRDSSLHFWDRHVPLGDRIPNSVYKQNPNIVTYNGSEENLDVEALFKFAEDVLSPKDHIIFMLAYEGFQYSDIGEIMGGNKPYAIRASAMRTRKKMKKFLLNEDTTSSEQAV